MARIVEIVTYDPAWPKVYRAEAVRIAELLGPNLIAVHHIGSTAVPGLAAKPIIDILLVVKAHAALDACNDSLQRLGFIPKGEHGIVGRRYFSKVSDEQDLFHMHAFEAGHPDIVRHLNFRDYLIAHPPIANEYQALKIQLAARFRNTPPEYTEAKSGFIRRVDVLAANWRAE